MCQLLDEDDYETLLDYYTDAAIERIEASIDHENDLDVLAAEAPACIEQVVASETVDDGDDYRRGTFAGDDVFKSRHWADNDHSLVFFASMLDADMNLYQDKRGMKKSAWRTEWEWFADKERFDNYNDKSSGPIRPTESQFEMSGSPFHAIRPIAFGLVCARVYQRVAAHYRNTVEQADDAETMTQ